MKMSIYVEPHELRDALDAYEKWLDDAQIESLNDALNDGHRAKISIDYQRGTATVEVL